MLFFSRERGDVRANRNCVCANAQRSAAHLKSCDLASSVIIPFGWRASTQPTNLTTSWLAGMVGSMPSKP